MYSKTCIICNQKFLSETKNRRICLGCYEKQCKHCGKTFSNLNKRKVSFCSKSCGISFAMSLKYEAVYKICLFCSKKFRVNPSQINIIKYCSADCRSNYKKSKYNKLECLQCNKSFSVVSSNTERKFCSKECFLLNREGVVKNCGFCRKDFKAYRYRNDTQKYCSKECFDSFQSSQTIKKICPTCGKSFIVPPCQVHIISCSRKCRLPHSSETRQKFSEAAKGRKKSPESIRRQVAAHYANNLYPFGKGLTKETASYIAIRAKNRSEKEKGVCWIWLRKHTLFCKTLEGRKQNSERMKKFYANNPHKHINYRLAQKGYETSIEKKMRLLLEEKQIPFEKQYKIDRFWVDFAVLESRIVIEVDGEYWHQDKEKDAQRDEIIESCGWRVLRFSDKQITDDIESCLCEIQKFLC